jgi:hypothetical protein
VEVRKSGAGEATVRLRLLGVKPATDLVPPAGDLVNGEPATAALPRARSRRVRIGRRLRIRRSREASLAGGCGVRGGVVRRREVDRRVRRSRRGTKSAKSCSKTRGLRDANRSRPASERRSRRQDPSRIRMDVPVSRSSRRAVASS